MTAALIDAINAETDMERRKGGVLALGDIADLVDAHGRQQAIAFLVQVLTLSAGKYGSAGKNGHERDDSYAARSVLPMYGGGSLPLLIQAMRKWGADVEFVDVMKTLVQENNDELVRQVIKELDNDSPQVRRGVGAALISLHPSRTEYLPAIVAAFRKKQSRDFRVSLAVILGNMGPAAAQAVPDLVRALGDSKDSYLRRIAAGALGQIGPSARDAVPDLVRALKDRHCDVRETAAEALAAIATPEARSAVESYEHCEEGDY